MTETNTALAEAIVTCGAIRAKLEVLQDMLTPKPVLTIESIIRPGHNWELHRPADLDCPEAPSSKRQTLGATTDSAPARRGTG